MDYYQGNKPCGDFSPTSILLSRIQVFWSPCSMQPITCCILSDVLCRTKIFWAFLVYFLLCIPVLSPSTFGFIILFLPISLWWFFLNSSLANLACSLLLYWLGVKLNIFLCTLLLNKDLHRSAFCAFVSLHTPCLFVCSNTRFLA